jgi:hypothetical protein
LFDDVGGARYRTLCPDRRFKLLLQLNKDWAEKYGGHLELWNRDMTKCEAKVPALYYFSNGRPAEEVTGAHSTMFRAWKETDFNSTVGRRVRSVAGSFAAYYHAEPAAGPVIALHIAPDNGPARRRSDLC